MPTPDQQSNPHIRDDYSPLDTLGMQALRRYGDFSPGTVDGDTLLMFIEFANMVVDEVNTHPYRESKPPILYYTGINDAREIPDPVIIAGLLAHYAAQQLSEKVETYFPLYYKTMNTHLWLQLNGNTKIHLRQVDESTRPESGLKTNPLNGLPE